MSLEVHDRSRDLVNAIYQVGSQQNRQSAMHEAARRGMELTLFTMRRNAPKGQVEPAWTWHSVGSSGTVNHGRPSIRQHGITLDAGWLQEMDRVDGGAEFVIYSVAPHILPVIEGTIPHPISGPLSFWWFKPTDGFPPGPRAFGSDDTVNHPGAKSNPFVAETAEQVRNRLYGLGREGVSRALKPLSRFFKGP